MLIRVGLPENTGHLPGVAVAHGYPCLVSAGRMWQKPTDKRPGYFRPPGRVCDGIADLALDSAGFVAMVHHGGYPWTVQDYVGLAASRPFTWWAQSDYCCEPEVAADREIVTDRVKGTAALLRECREAAEAIGLPPPLPVLQGWRPEDYTRSADLADKVLGGTWPDLVGVGSVCRRKLAEPYGVRAIIAQLDRILPAHVHLHAFGQQGDSIPWLASQPRMGSLDSCAWDDGERHDLQDRRRELMVLNPGMTIEEATDVLPSSVIDRGRAMVAWWDRCLHLRDHVAPPRQPSLFW